ncbi:hypothetical protein KY332_00490 [Candidatus Woesearchaeota archaeon]|nr:hypothetical protein [Candidatus Woesearchaeota archaeon]
MGVFVEGLELLESMGLVDVLLPFLLIFTIVFAVLQKSKILGEDKKNFNVIVALVIGLSVVIPHALGTYPAGYDVVDIMNSVLPQISLIAVAFVMLMILAGIVGVNIAGKSFAGLFVLISLIAVVAIFGASLGWWDSAWFYNIFGEETVAIVIMILVFGLIIWFITSGDKSRGQELGAGVKKFFDWMAGR